MLPHLHVPFPPNSLIKFKNNFSYYIQDFMHKLGNFFLFGRLPIKHRDARAQMRHAERSGHAFVKTDLRI